MSKTGISVKEVQLLNIECMFVAELKSQSGTSFNELHSENIDLKSVFPEVSIQGIYSIFEHPLNIGVLPLAVILPIYLIPDGKLKSECNTTSSTFSRFSKLNPYTLSFHSISLCTYLRFVKG
ncbi:MAG: hypothetical protein IIW92_00870 [Lachnospiraceae bacterium]|nr:hypothetical protein [Lachnospiraceae bacterium]